ncbi:hypothetical protein CFP56_038693 [Quercus suber]|uniref:DUF4283 domain-containing protein n=1 Tax=Quercus suber TaxID=58331 RepID=A0AAW0J1K2_QUESU
MGASEFGSPPSYRDKLVGEMPGTFAQTFNLDSHEMDMSNPPVSMGELVNGIVAFNLDPVTRRVINLWKPAGRLDCINLGRDFFLMRFELVEDFENVIKGGPWFIGGHFLTIRVWEPNFKPASVVFKDLKQAPKVVRLDSSADKADTSGEDGDCSQEVGKTEVDLKCDGKEAYGPWLIVKRKKAGAKSEGMRYTNQGVDVGPGKGHFRYDENSCKHVNKSHEKPPYDVKYRFDREKMEAGHRVSFSPPSFRVKKKINPLSMDQRPQSSKETHFHETEVPVFSFDVETKTKKATSSCPSDVCVLGVNSFGGATILFGSVSNGKGDGRDGWPEPTKREAQIFGWRALSKLERLGTRGRRSGKENLDVQDGGSEVLGNVISKSLLQGKVTMGGVKPTDFIKGSTDRSAGTHGAPCTGSGFLQESSEGVRMEVSEQDGSSVFA